TRWPRDWSSDVCSSDLRKGGVMKRLAAFGVMALALATGGWPVISASRMLRPDKTRLAFQRDVGGGDAYADAEWRIVPREQTIGKIGRASGRERGGGGQG